MTETTPDYAGLIERLNHRASTMNGAEPVGFGDGHTYVTGYYTVSDRMLDREAATALEAQAAELAAVKEMYAREGAKALYELERAEAAEARVKELEDLCNSLEAQAMGLADDLKRAEAKLAEKDKALKLAEFMMTKDSLCKNERLEEGLAVIRRARNAGGNDD